MRIAITRAVSPRLSECELTFRDRVAIDPARATAQHEAYERWLETHGCRLVRAAPAPAHPDGVFVEDAAVVLDEVAVITRPGAASRRGETDSIARALHRYRAVRSVEEPGTIDGGDVLRVGHTLFVGQTRRTNDRGISQLREVAGDLGYTVVPTPVRECLHLKSAATAVDDHTILYDPECVEPHLFDGLDAIAVDPAERAAANVLRIGSSLLMSSSYPRTREMLEGRGYTVDTIDFDELEKAEAGVTCCSVIFEM